MKNQIRYTLFILLGLLIACEQEEFVGSGLESLRDFSVVGVEGARVALNPLTPDDQIVIEWNQARSGFGSDVTYTWLVDEVNGDFSSPLLSIPADESGAATKLTLTHQAFEEALSGLGIAAGAETEVWWSVRATNGDVTKIADPSPVSVIRYRERLADFTLSGPADAAELFLLASSPDAEVQVSWAESRAGLGADITYTWIADAVGGDFSDPLLSLPADNNGQDATLTLTFQQLDDALASLGVPEAGAVDIIWTVEAAGGGVTQRSSQVNQLKINRFGAGIELTFQLGQSAAVPEGYGVYLAGEFGNLGVAESNWQEPGSNPGLALELVDGTWKKTFAVPPASDGTTIQYKYFLVPNGGTSWSNGEQSFSNSGCQGLASSVQGTDNRVFQFSAGDFSPQTMESNVVTWEGFCAAEGMNLVRFTVDVPENTPADLDVYLTGDVGVVTWAQPGRAAGMRMRNIGGTTYELFIPMSVGQTASFKFFLATTQSPNWGNGEQQPNGDNTGCDGVDNRSFTYDGANEFTGVVQTWEGFCPF